MYGSVICGWSEFSLKKCDGLHLKLQHTITNFKTRVTNTYEKKPIALRIRVMVDDDNALIRVYGLTYYWGNLNVFNVKGLASVITITIGAIFTSVRL